MRSHKTLSTIFFAMLFTVNSVQAQENIFSALKTEKCKKIGQATATVVTLRDGGADEVGVHAVMDVGLPKDDPAQEQLAQIIKDVFQFKELSLHSHRMYRWVGCANSSLGKSTKNLEVLAPELKQCQSLKSPQTQVNCMSSVVSGS